MVKKAPDKASYKGVLLGRPTKYAIGGNRTSFKPPGRSRSFAMKQMAILGHEDNKFPEKSKHEQKGWIRK